MEPVVGEEEFDEAPQYSGDIDEFVEALEYYYPKAVAFEKLITDYSRLGKPDPEKPIGRSKRSRNLAMLEVLCHLGHIDRKNVDGVIYYRATSGTSSSDSGE